VGCARDRGLGSQREISRPAIPSQVCIASLGLAHYYSNKQPRRSISNNFEIFQLNNQSCTYPRSSNVCIQAFQLFHLLLPLVRNSTQRRPQRRSTAAAVTTYLSTAAFSFPFSPLFLSSSSLTRCRRHPTPNGVRALSRRATGVRLRLPDATGITLTRRALLLPPTSILSQHVDPLAERVAKNPRATSEPCPGGLHLRQPRTYSILR
jgi:hypothetical protein